MGLEMDPAPPLTPALALRSLRVALGFDFSFDLGFMVLWGAGSLAGLLMSQRLRLMVSQVAGEAQGDRGPRDRGSASPNRKPGKGRVPGHLDFPIRRTDCDRVTVCNASSVKKARPWCT